jgi:flagellar biosynthetic protein FlhB
MAELENRNEEPTEHRLAEARRRGAVPVSRDLQAGLTALAICVALILGGPSLLTRLLACLRDSLGQACSRSDLVGAGRTTLLMLIGVLEIPLGVALVVALVSGAVLTRGLISARAVCFDLGRIRPSLRRKRRREVWADIGKALGATSIVVALAWWTMRPTLAGLVYLNEAPAGRALSVLSNLAQTLGLRLGLAAVVLGVVDQAWQRYQHRRSLRMTRDEVRREQRERDGDPQLKNAREEIRFKFLREQATEDVRRADLVVVDGEDRAVALRYDPADFRAPLVVCKGERVMAAKMVQIARESNVPIRSAPSLVMMLAQVDEDSEIPEASHEAVARLLAGDRD